MNDTELDAVYTQLCRSMTELGEAQAPLFLARLAMLALARQADGEAAMRLIVAAAQDLEAPQG